MRGVSGGALPLLLSWLSLRPSNDEASLLLSPSADPIGASVSARAIPNAILSLPEPLFFAVASLSTRRCEGGGWEEKMIRSSSSSPQSALSSPICCCCFCFFCCKSVAAGNSAIGGTEIAGVASVEPKAAVVAATFGRVGVCEAASVREP